MISHIENLKNSLTILHCNYWELHPESQENFSDCHVLNKYALKNITFTLQPTNKSLYSCISLCYFSLVIFYDFSPCSFFYVTYLRSGLLFVWLPLNLCKRKPHIYSTPFSSVFILFPFPFTNLDFYSPLFCFCFYLYSNHIS